MTDIEIIERAIASTRREVVEHPIAGHLDNPDRVRTFMEHHVWAVWGFMHLLNGLRREFTSPVGAWVPPPRPTPARIVNEIVLGEESDAAFGGRSHFDVYRLAMLDLDADTGPITSAVDKIGVQRAEWAEVNPVNAAREAGAPLAALRFLRHDWRVATGPPLELVAAFCFGRETLIPAMFGPILERAEGARLRQYLDRHIEVDAEHGDSTLALVASVARDPLDVWAMIGAARSALVARRSLWDATLTAMMETR